MSNVEDKILKSIKTHFKVQRVIDSCTSKDHYKYAERYIDLAKKSGVVSEIMHYVYVENLELRQRIMSY